MDRRKTKWLDDHRFRILAESAPNVLWICNPEDLTVEYVNPAYEKIWGHRCEEIYGNLGWMDTIHPDDRERIGKAFEKIIEFRMFDQEYRIVRPDKKIRWIHDRGWPVLDDQGVPIQLVGIAEDITDRKRAEESQRQLRRSERLASIGFLSAGLAHQINNPLAAILLCARAAIADKDNRDAIDEALHDICQQAERAGRIVKSVLRFAGERTTPRWPTDLSETIERACAATKIRAKQSDLDIELDLCEQVPKLNLNPTEIEHVFTNLIENAIHACTDKCRVTIRTFRRDKSIRTTVTDNGCGIAEDDAKHVFDPFFTTRLGSGGTGLGLSLVHRIVTENSGSISVNSKPGEGTTFTIDFPLQETP